MPTRPNRVAVSIALTYFVAATAWILFSDTVVDVFLPDHFRMAQTFKGVFFVLASAGIIHLVTYRYLSRALAEEAAAHRSAEYSEALLNASPGAVIALAEDLSIMAVNPAAERVFGVPASKLVGYFVPELVSEASGGLLADLANRASSGEIVAEVSGLVCVRGGRRFWASAWAAPLPQAGGSVFVVLDRTSEWRMLRREERRAVRLKSMGRRVALAVEDERREIAMVLHDGLGQTLAAVKMNLGLIDAGCADPESRAAATISLVDQAIGATRTLTYALSPPLLHSEGLAAALEWLATRMDELEPQTHWTAKCEHVDVERSTGALLYRVVAELVTNVSRHAQASNAWIELRREGGEIEIRVVDDGVGFERVRPEEFGLGLAGASFRLAKIGGTLDIASHDGRTILTVRATGV